LNIKPGKPFAFGIAPNGTPIFCLPGNPVSSAVTFHKLVRPAIAAMMGEHGEDTTRFYAALEEDIEKKDTRVHYVRGILRRAGGRITVRTTGLQASNILTSIAHANCLIVLPEEARTYAAGESVEVELV
jgi:molybdopterin molybdotransferase